MTDEPVIRRFESEQYIEELEIEVSSLKSRITELKQENERQRQTIAAQETVIELADKIMHADLPRGESE